jgi:hypothetical protein
MGCYLLEGCCGVPKARGRLIGLAFLPHKRPVSGCYLIGGNSPRSQLFGAGSGALRVIRAC